MRLKKFHQFLYGTILLLCIIIFILFLLPKSSFTLSKKEKAYLAKVDKIKVGVDYAFAPYEFVDQDGKVVGFTIDLLQKISEYFGIRFQFIPGTWKDCLQRFRDGELDMLNNVTPTASREKYMKFSETTNIHTSSIYVPNFVQSVKGLDDLRQHKIGMKRGTSLLEQLKNRSDLDLQIISFQDPKEMVKALQNNEIIAVIDYDFPFQYVLFNLNIQNIKQVGSHISFEIGTFAVHKDDHQLLQILNKGITSISSEEKELLEEKWLGMKHHIVFLQVIKKYITYLIIAILIFIIILFWNQYLQWKLKQKNQRIIENEKKYRTLFNSNNDLIFLINDEKIIECNKVVFDKLKWKEAELIGENFDKIFCSSEKELIKLQINLQKVNEYNSAEFKSVICTNEGDSLFVHIDLEQLKLAGKDCIFVVMRDISNYKRLIEELRVKQEQFSAFMEHFPGGIFIKDKELHFLYLNPYMKKIVSDKNWFGKKPDQLFSPEAAMKQIETDKLALKQGFIKREEEIQDQEGNIGFYTTYKFRTNLPLGDILLGGIALDITKMKKIENKLKNSKLQLSSIFAAMEDFVCEVDFEGRYLFIAPTNDELMFGEKSDLVGHTLREVFPKDLAEKFLQFVRKTIQTKKVQSIEYPLKIENKTIWFEGRAHPKTENSIIYIARDITERKNNEKKLQDYREHLEMQVEARTKELKRSQFALQNLMEDTIGYQKKVVSINELLKESNQELEAFAYSVSHDLRAPLRHIDGFSKLLENRIIADLDEKSQNYLNNIHESIIYMSKLIDALLTYSRTTRKTIRKEKINMGKIVERALNLYEEQIKEYHFEVKKEKFPEVFVDATLMTQVWTNFISNAIKFTKEKEKPKIVLGSKIEKDETVFYIKDNGIGFQSEYKDKIFGVFQRLHSEKNYTGTGIGLANVKKIIEKHSGEIWTESAINQGTAFYFTISNL